MEKLGLIQKMWLITVISLVLVSSFYLTVVTNRNYLVKQRIILGGDQLSPNTLVVKAKYNLTVIRDGKVIAIRQKEDDPISIQWYRLVADMMFGFIRDGAVSWYDIDYNEHTEIDIEFNGVNPRLYLVLGSGVGDASNNDYKLFNEVTKSVPSMSVDDEGDRYEVIITKSFTVDQSFTLTEVGLELYVDVLILGSPTSCVATSNYIDGKYVLIAHDNVDPSIDLVQDDVVTVTYTITIPYDVNGVFTRWFYNALINYFLGYKGTTGNSLELKAESGNTGGFDTGTDKDAGSNCYSDSIIEDFYIEIGDGVSTVNPLFETYSLSNMLQRTSIADTEFNNYIEESGSFTIKYIVSFSFTESATIYEIGVSYYTDRNTGSSSVGDYYLLMYWKLPSAIQVDSGDGLRIEIEIVIPYV